ncbi:MAG TPA: MarC family protein [Bdellovibrio sp.]|uniref:MarC family protein n=1 Tax=Bdellovibrio sp. TaxID=28201 RepID=UPI002F171F9C
MSHYLIGFFKDLLLVVAALVPIINPMGQMPIFLSLTQDIPDEDRKILAQKIATYGFFLLLISMMIGTYVLKFFGISIAAVQIGGGLLVCASGWTLLNTNDSQKTLSTNQQQAAENPEAQRAAYSRRAFYPLTFPLSVGPGSVSVAITLGANMRSDEGTMEAIMLLSSFLALIIVAAITYICYRFAKDLISKLGDIGTIVILRMSAFILLCLGVQIISNGLIELIPHMLGHATV